MKKENKKNQNNNKNHPAAPDVIISPLADKIKGLRKERNWSQEDLEEFSGVSVRQISRIESGKCEPSVETLLKLAEAFEVSFSFLDNDNSENSDRIEREAFIRNWVGGTMLEDALTPRQKEIIEAIVKLAVGLARDRS